MAVTSIGSASGLRGENLGSREAQKHQSRLRNTGPTPLRNRSRRDFDQRGGSNRPAELVDQEGVFVFSSEFVHEVHFKCTNKTESSPLTSQMFKLAYMNLSERLAAAMRHKGITNKSEIARAGNVSPSNITQILKGDIKAMKGPTARGIAGYCGVNAVWLEAGLGQMLDVVEDHDNVQLNAPHDNGRLGNMRRAFLKGTAQMGKEGYWYDLDYPEQDGDGHVVVPSEDPNVYCIRVRGDSMYPAIRDNWIVVVEPSLPLIPGQYLHVHTTDGRYMVKELLFKDESSGALTLHSVNPSFGRLTLQADEIVYAYYCWPIPPAKWRP